MNEDEIWMSNALRGLCLLNGTSQPKVVCGR